jgi:hypothetical protein
MQQEQANDNVKMRSFWDHKRTSEQDGKEIKILRICFFFYNFHVTEIDRGADCSLLDQFLLNFLLLLLPDFAVPYAHSSKFISY